MANTHTFPNAPFFREVRALLREHIKVTIHVQGGSMRPFLHNGDKVLLAPVAPEKLSEGDIVLARTSAGVLLHRIVRIRKKEICLAGDANSRLLEHIEREDVIGVVDEAWRKGKSLHINSVSKRALACFWYLIRPFRGYILGACCRLKQSMKQ